MFRDLLKLKDLFLEESKTKLKEKIEKETNFSKIPASLDNIKKSLNESLDQNINKINESIKKEYADIKDIYYEFKTSKALKTLYKNSINGVKETVALNKKETLVLYSYLLDDIKNTINNVRHTSDFKINSLKNLIDNATMNISDEDAITFLASVLTLLLMYNSSKNLYLQNQKDYQSKSYDTFKQNTSSLSCVNIEEPLLPENIIIKPRDVSIDNISLNNFSCDINTEFIKVPHDTFNNKQSNFSCEIPLEENIQLDDLPIKNELSSKAIIDANFKNIYVQVGDNINENSIIGITDTRTVSSPVLGNIFSISNNSIVIDNISDPLTYPEILKAQELADIYKESIILKDMINQYYVKCSLPIMLINSINFDRAPSPIELLNVRHTGVKILYNNSTDEYKVIIENYERNVKNIASQENVKTKAENNEVEKIKIDFDIEEKSLFDNTKQFYNDIIEESKQSINIIGDLNLKNYYEEIYNKLNAIENPIDIQKNLKDNIKKFFEDRTSLLQNENSLIKNESIYIQNYFNELFLKLDKNNSRVIEIENELKNINSLTSYTIQNINDEDYRYYKVNELEEESCVTEDEDPYLSPKSAKQPSDLDYWLKYCGYATLASVINYPLGWSTGFLGPNGPILFPVIFIPIKPIPIKYGFIVIGITLCGIYPFPWILMTNYTSDYVIPIGDPTQILKNEVQSFKKELSDQLKEFKFDIINNLLKEKETQIDDKEKQLQDTEQTLYEHKQNKPQKSVYTELEMKQKYNEVINKVNYLSQYAQQLIAWEENKISLMVSVESIKLEKYVLEQEYKILYEISTIGKSKDKESTNPAIQAVENAQEALVIAEEKINSLLDNINRVLSVIPLSLEPMSTSFGPTIKKPVPKTKIEDELDDNINANVLDNVTSQFDISNEILMSENFNEEISNTPIGNYTKYTNQLKAKMNLIVKKDPFPKYENLQPTNIAWSLFLINEWSTTAAKVYGIPGQLPQ